jgi:parallel beta-helix repeat protein
VLLLSGSLLTLSLSAASPAAAVTCTVKNPAPPGPNGFTTIQAAIASVAPNCTVINVKPGTYAGPITIDHNVVLRGTSTTNTIINLAGNVVNPLSAIIEVVAPATTVTIEKFTIAGPGAGGCGSLLFGILVRDGATATIKNNHITAIRDNPLSGCQNGNAIQVGRNSLGTTGHAVIEHNTIDDYQKTGIVVDGLLAGPVSTATIKDNDVIGDVNGACFPDFRCSPIAAQNGIQISRRANATISQNTIVEHRYDPAVAGSGGILLFDAGDDVTVSSNTVERNDVGIWVIGTSTATILNNKVRSSTFDGIAIQHVGGNPTGSNTVSKNTATLNGNGIGLYDTGGNTIERNIVSTSEGPGIAVDATSSGNVLTQNKATKNFTFGIEDESIGGGTAGTANTYSGNSCTGNGTAKSDPAGLC